MAKTKKIPEQYAPVSSAPPVRLTIALPEKLKREIKAYAYRKSQPDNLVTMGAAARDLIMRALLEEENTHG